MWSYQYKHGDTPLEGYTIQRAAGRGGFGEVYYAISDAGREVALKVVTGYEQIELRGIGQCMNLKSPHLVSIFDVKHNAQGKPFVIMEFVSGPSLRQLLDEHPSGLGEQKAAFFLREIGKGLTFLHDCGIVHRDLKPGNVFYENGYVKIGDYGLSKAMATSPHSGQTVTVGTVHYMAPEVGAGKYDRGIDIYALGAVLYEMLIGMPPFVGASPSEVLLKHLSAQPDCSGISEPFATAIKRAMAKDPAQRFQSVQEMVEAVFGAEHVQQSMSVFSPEELSVVAERVAKHVGVGAAVGAGAQTPPPIPPRTSTDQLESNPWDRAAQRFGQISDRIADRTERLNDQINKRIKRKFGNRHGGTDPVALNSDPSRDMTVPIEDPIPLPPRIAWAVITTLIIAYAAAVLTRRPDSGETFLIICGAIPGAVLAAQSLRSRMSQLLREPAHTRRLLIGAVVAVGMLIVPAVAAENGGMQRALFAMALPLFLLDVAQWINPMRPERIRLSHAITAAIIAMIACIPLNGAAPLAMAVAAGTALALQTISPWQARARVPNPSDPKPDIASAGTASPPPAAKPMQVYGNITVDTTEAQRMRDAGVQVFGNVKVQNGATATGAVSGIERYWSRRVPTPIRFVWLGAFAVALSLSIAFFVIAGNTRYSRDVVPFASIATAAGLFAVLSLKRSLMSTYYGIWHYLLRGLLSWAALSTAIISMIILANAHLRIEEIAVTTGFLVFSLVVLIVMVFIPGKHLVLVSAAAAASAPTTVPAAAVSEQPMIISPYKRLWALLLSGAVFAGCAGIQRLYVGKIASGILYVCTGGLFGIGQLIDVIMIFSGTFTDKQGRRLVLWEDESELNTLDARNRRLAVGSPSMLFDFSRGLAPTTSMAHSLGRHARGLLSAMVGLLLFIGTVLGLAIAIDLPSAIQAGVFGSNVPGDIQQFFGGYDQWPGFVMRIAIMLVSLIFVIAATAMLLVRRRFGGMHQLAGLIGIGVLLGFLKFVGATFSHFDWVTIAAALNSEQIPAAIDSFLNQINEGKVIVAPVLLLASMLILMAPHRSQTPQTQPAPVAPRDPSPTASTEKVV